MKKAIFPFVLSIVLMLVTPLSAWAEGVTARLQSRLNQCHSPLTSLEIGQFIGLSSH
jgi:hypothetical protein